MGELTEALRWITGMLTAEKITYQIVGGLAARGYGATRPIHDIDLFISESGLSRLYKRVEQHVLKPPERRQNEHFDLTRMVIEYKGQDIDIGVVEGAMIFSTEQGRWVPRMVALDDYTVLSIEGVTVPVIPLSRLLAYKRILGRDVDLQDIQETSRSRNTR